MNSFLFSKLPDECRLRAGVEVHNIDAVDDYYRGAIYSELRQSLAQEMVKTRMREVRGAFTTRYTVDLIVLDPDQFAQIVQEEALQLQRRMNRPSIKP